MTRDEIGEFSMLWDGVMEVYGRDASDTAVSMCFAALSRFSLDDVKQGLSRHVADPKRGQYPPKPADVVFQLEGSSEDAAVVDEAQALAAWQTCLEAVREVGPYSDCPVTDPRALAAIEDAGGWAAFCDLKTAEIPFSRRAFLAAYKLLDAPKTPRATLGIHGRKNAIGGGATAIGAHLKSVQRREG